MNIRIVTLNEIKLSNVWYRCDINFWLNLKKFYFLKFFLILPVYLLILYHFLFLLIFHEKQRFLSHPVCIHVLHTTCYMLQLNLQQRCSLILFGKRLKLNPGDVKNNKQYNTPCFIKTPFRYQIVYRCFKELEKKNFFLFESLFRLF